MYKEIYVNVIKRILDIILSLLAIIVLTPIMIVIALIVKKRLGSPIIFKQERLGIDKHTFNIYKFRTMNNKKSANGKLLPDIQRIDKFGEFLRNYSLDELPELFNILKGDMSIVGPRPLLLKYKEYYTKEEDIRHTVKPGLTGLAQINGRNGLGWHDRFQMDIAYINNIGFLEDTRIILKTIKKVLKREGVIITERNSMLDLDEERKLYENIEIRKITLDDIINEKTKIEHYMKSLSKISGCKIDIYDEYNNMILYTKNNMATIFGAFENNNLVGFIWCYKNKDRVHVNYFYIEENYRKKHLGKRLLEAVEKYAKSIGIQTIELNVYHVNKNAFEFYKKQNFIEERILLCKRI